MAIILKKDTLKLPFSKKMGITIMVLTGIALAAIIFANINWLKNYDYDHILSAVKKKIENPTLEDLDAFVRIRAIIAIVGNTLVLGFFSAMIWWSINGKRLGLAFGSIWMFIFVGNAISTPFYSIQVDAFSIVLAIAHLILGSFILVWLSGLIAYRSRLKQEIARGRG